MKFLYGTKDSNIDVTDICYKNLMKDNIIKIGGNSDLEEAMGLTESIHKSNVSIDAVYGLYKNMYKK